ncbi:hypothetical protein EDB83DRAFT_2318099 [Lactarius deliciosus]|nr:hypothetical protein EDB83DRAFT_2318099 [Lactarius deliciosus]
MRLFIGGDHMIEIIRRTALHKLHTASAVHARTGRGVSPEESRDGQGEESLRRNWSTVEQIMECSMASSCEEKCSSHHILVPVLLPTRLPGLDAGLYRPNDTYPNIVRSGQNLVSLLVLLVLAAMARPYSFLTRRQQTTVSPYVILTVRNKRAELLAVEASSDQSQGNTQVKHRNAEQVFWGLSAFGQFGSRPVPKKKRADHGWFS